MERVKKMSVVCLLIVGVCAGGAAADMNMCLPENGGTLESGNEGIRNDDFMDHAMTIGGQSGSMEACISFPARDLDYVEWGVGGSTYQYDGGARAWAYLDLLSGSDWVQIKDWSWSTWQSYHDIGADDNGGFGWDDVSAIRLRGRIEAFDTGTAVLAFHEMQAWVIPEPATLWILGGGGVGLLWRRRRRA